jgi:integrase
VNLDVLALAGVYKRAKREGIVSASPTDGWEPLRHQAPKRPLWSEEDIQKLVNAAAGLNTNPQLVVDYLLFLALSGARRREALSLRWEDIDFQRWTVNFSRDTKYGKARTLDMSESLFKHLTAMHSRRCNQKPSPWLFPSPARVADQPARDLSDSVEQARKAAGLESLRLHDLRHAFLSRGVMAGVDYMTLAQWAGHSDGGVLIGKVYGHLSDDHRKRMAQKM